jgi:tagatose-1,6-bisphosphate aldolase
MLAGLNLKNTVSALSEQASKLLEERWKALAVDQRTAVKNMLLQILQDPERKVRNVSALVRKKQTLELPQTCWPAFSATLMNNKCISSY